MRRGKIIYYSILIMIVLLITSGYVSYAYLTSKNEESGKLNIVVGTLNYKIESEDLENNEIEITANTTRTITVTITSLNSTSSKYELYYNIKNNEKDIEIGYSSNTKDSVKGIIKKEESKEIEVVIKNNSNNKVTVVFGVHGGLEKLAYDEISDIGNSLNEMQTSDVVIAWNYVGSGTKPESFPAKNSGYYVDSVSCSNATGSWDNSNWELKVKEITGSSTICTITFGDTYKELILNGADPVLTDNLVPVVISDTGVVTKTDINQEWYSYENKIWANAVVLKDESISYSNNQEIPEDNIESYFVWIPRYKYQIFNTGSYTGLTSFESSAQVINIVFENKETEPSTGSTVGSYLTHPAFTSFDTNGIWIGKFETGYDGATSTSGAQVSSGSTTDIIIKPNVYSWRYLTVGSMFKLSYDYLRNDDSHVMKNTEWGAVAYLSHSIYGINTEVRINNNSNNITGYAATEEPTLGYNSKQSIEGNRFEGTTLGVDGTYTINYLNPNSVVASTTGNYSGIYDMSGGAGDYVMGYTTKATTTGGSSGITNIYSDFFTNSVWEKYYDKYTSTTETNFDYRILGDATGELGPFGSEVNPDHSTGYISSWYKDYTLFVSSTYSWFTRGGTWWNGNGAGSFVFTRDTGGAGTCLSFRLVLAPTK